MAPPWPKLLVTWGSPWEEMTDQDRESVLHRQQRHHWTRWRAAVHLLSSSAMLIRESKLGSAQLTELVVVTKGHAGHRYP